MVYIRELVKLANLLATHYIPYEWRDSDIFGEKTQIVVWKNEQKEDMLCDIICHRYSHGGSKGLLEICGEFVDTEDGVKGWLTAELCFSMISEAYQQIEKEGDDRELL